MVLAWRTLEDPSWDEPREAKLRRLAGLRNDPDDLATNTLAEIEKLRAEVAELRAQVDSTTPPP